jgi:subtilisin family serine protease
MLRLGHLVMTLREGEHFGHVPARLDFLDGNARAASRLDGGAIDRVLSRLGGGARALAVFHARASLARPAERHVGYDDLEESLGMSRTYRIGIGEPERTYDVVSALRDLALVESAGVQLLSVTEEQPPDGALDREGVRELAREPHARIGAPQALAAEDGDERVTVAVVDTGMVVGHPEFQRKCLAGYDTVDLGIGRLNDRMRLVGDSRGADYTPFDDVGHGCHVAGVIGAQGWRIPRGVAGRAMLLPVRVLAAAMAEGSTKRIGVGALPDIDCGLKVACDLGADVMNMSFGTAPQESELLASTPHQQVLDYAARKDVVLVAAAGNSGRCESYYPARHPAVMAVASVDREGQRSTFSTWGDHITIAAPGERIVSAAADGRYQVNTGTSFAAPFVAGVAALMRGRARRRGRRVPAAVVQRLIVESATPLPGASREEAGAGLLNAPRALAALDRWMEAHP